MLIDTLLAQADSLYRNGDLDAAAGIYSRLCESNAASIVAQYMLGVISAQQGRHDEALRLMETALQFSPTHPVMLSSRATLLNNMGRRDEALADCNQALEADPQCLDALVSRGNILFGLDRHAEALASYDAAILLSPDNALTWANRAIALRALKRFDEALEASDRAIAIEPGNAGALNDRANTLYDLKRFDQALLGYEAVLAVAPRFAAAWSGRGYALLALHRFDEALASCDKALDMAPDLVTAWNGRGTALFRLHRFEDALHSCDRALSLEPDNADAWNSRGNVLRASNRFEEALYSFDRALAIDKTGVTAFAGAAAMALVLCDWKRTETIGAEIPARVHAGSPISPFTVLGYSDDNMFISQSAANTIKDAVRIRPRPLYAGAGYPNKKIRIAYLSSDFSQHPVAFQIVQLVELHDRSKFEVFGISTGYDDGSEIRRRMISAFDHFLDARAQTDRSVAEFLLRNRVDILIDLNGHTEGSRFGILAHRACPVQVSWLGYPGTTGSDFIDYLIADGIVAPASHQPFFSEKLCHLPGTYFVSDASPRADLVLARAAAGLPEGAFVFCCFNASWKITRPIFEIWMALLAKMPASVLWLKDCHARAKQNLAEAALSCGVDPARILFAEEAGREFHLARYRLADLFLDTLPYNAHATACDALAASLPLITCQGKSFAGRVASSLLDSAGLPELITGSLDEYESRALELATNPGKLQLLRDRLERAICDGKLFDTNRFRAHIESAFAAMVKARRQPG